MSNPAHVLSDEQVIFQAQGSIALEAEQVLELQEKSLRNRILWECLVKWRFYPLEDATWGKEDDFIKDFPQFER